MKIKLVLSALLGGLIGISQWSCAQQHYTNPILEHRASIPESMTNDEQWGDVNSLPRFNNPQEIIGNNGQSAIIVPQSNGSTFVGDAYGNSFIIP